MKAQIKMNSDGSTNSVPAMMPPQVLCISQPMYTASCWASGPGSTMQ